MGKQLKEKLRFYLGRVLAVIVLFSCTRGIWWPGIAIASVGLLIRIWATGHIQKNVTLCTCGPYAYTRNPLYLGSLIITVGFCLAVRRPLLLAFTLLLFLLVYYPVIFREEKKLKDKFPQASGIYYQSVPRLIPNPFRGKFTASSKSSTDWKRGIRKEKLGILGFVGAVFLIAILSYLVYP